MEGQNLTGILLKLTSLKTHQFCHFLLLYTSCGFGSIFFLFDLHFKHSSFLGVGGRVRIHLPVKIYLHIFRFVLEILTMTLEKWVGCVKSISC